MQTFYNYLGRPLNLVNLGEQQHEANKQAKARKQPRSKRVDVRREATHSMGFAVTGFPPDMVSSARTAASNEGKAFDLEAWCRTAKRIKVRIKPYELPQAADECAAMAVKAGWIGVRVTELMRRVEKEQV